MRLGNFEVIVRHGRELREGHVVMRHGQQYHLWLKNHRGVRCDARVSIDGKVVGDFRLEAYGSMTLERPVHDTGCFTFFRADSAEGEASGAGKLHKSEQGLVQVVFRPEKARPRTVGLQGMRSARPAAAPDCMNRELRDEPMGLCSAGAEDSSRGLESFGRMEAGVTGLTGASGQRFVEAPAIEYDPAGHTVISLRLVAEDVEAVKPVREMTAAPLANPVPPAV